MNGQKENEFLKPYGEALVSTQSGENEWTGQIGTRSAAGIYELGDVSVGEPGALLGRTTFMGAPAVDPAPAPAPDPTPEPVPTMPALDASPILQTMVAEGVSPLQAYIIYRERYAHVGATVMNIRDFQTSATGKTGFGTAVLMVANTYIKASILEARNYGVHDYQGLSSEEYLKVAMDYSLLAKQAIKNLEQVLL